MDAQGEPGETGSSAMLTGVVPAGSGRRAASAAVSVLAGVAVTVAPAVLSTSGGASPGLSAFAACLTGGAYLVGTGAILGRTGRSLGGLVTGVRTVDVGSATPLDARNALLRLLGREPRPVLSDGGTTRLRPGRVLGPWNRMLGTLTADLSVGRDPVSLALPPIPPERFGVDTGPAATGPDGPTLSPRVAAAPSDPSGRTDRVAPVAERTASRPRRGVGCVLTIDNGSLVRLSGTALLGRNPSSADRDPNVTLVPLPDLSRTLSKTHATIEWDGTDAWVQDMHSTNGSAILGTDGTRLPLAPGARTLLPSGAALLVGNRMIRFSPDADTGAASGAASGAEVHREGAPS